MLLVAPEAVAGAMWQIASRAGAEAVLVMPQAEPLLAARLTDVASTGRPARTVAVVPGRGGAGASTLAVALAVTSRRVAPGARTLLVDGDRFAGGLDLLLGAEAVPGLRWPALAAARGRLGADELRVALPQVDGLTLLSWDRGAPVDLSPAAAEAVVAAGRRGHDLVVLDLPRWPDPSAGGLLRLADLVLVVVPADVPSAAAASRVVAALAPAARDLRVVARSSRACRLPPAELARSVGAPLAGETGWEPGLAAAAERGEPPARTGRGSLARLCRALLAEVLETPGRAA